MGRTGARRLPPPPDGGGADAADLPGAGPGGAPDEAAARPRVPLVEYVPLPVLEQGSEAPGGDVIDLRESAASPRGAGSSDPRSTSGSLAADPFARSGEVHRAGGLDPTPGTDVDGGGTDDGTGLEADWLGAEVDEWTGAAAAAPASAVRPPVPVARRATALAVLATAAVVVAAVLGGVLHAVADARARDAAALDATAARAVRAGALGGELHAGVVELAVGRPAPGAVGGLRRTAGRLAGTTPPDVPGATAADRLAVALRERDRLVAAVGVVLDDVPTGEVVWPERLPVLESRQDAHTAAWTRLAEELRRTASERRDDADRWRLAGALVPLPGLGVAAALLWGMRRRLRSDLDEPLAVMMAAATSWGRGHGDVRTGLRPTTDVGALGRELDASTDANVRRMRRLRQQAEWGAQSRMIFEALDLVETEGEAHQVADRALGLIDPVVPVEFLLSPHGSRELLRVAQNRSVPPPSCPVPSTDACPAIRRGQTAVWESSESINACPKLRDRPQGPCSAVCVPVTVAGRPVGVIHATGRDRRPPPERFNTQLGTLSTQLGNRLGALRALESSRQDAATDKLTALPNRRLLEAELGSLIEGAVPFVLVLADLDRFKNLNDTYGHEVGDRALQLFAQVLRDKVRGNDVVARYGGEEFVLVYPRMSLTTSIEAIERIRDALASELDASNLPEFTCSFGITHSSVGHSAEAILRVADAGLLRAKELGGDQVVFADEGLAARIFGEPEI